MSVINRSKHLVGISTTVKKGAKTLPRVAVVLVRGSEDEWAPHEESIIMSKIDGFINWLYFWKVFAAGWTGFEPTRLTVMALRIGMSKFVYVRLSCNSAGENISSLVWIKPLIKLKIIRLLLKVKNSSESKERKLLYGLPILMNDRDGFFTSFNGEKPNNKQKIIN